MEIRERHWSGRAFRLERQSGKAGAASEPRMSEPINGPALQGSLKPGNFRKQEPLGKHYPNVVGLSSHSLKPGAINGLLLRDPL